MSKTIEEISNNKHKLCTSIANLIKEFEEENEVEIDDDIKIIRSFSMSGNFIQDIEITIQI